MEKNIYELYKECPRKKLNNSYIENVFDQLLEDELKPYVNDLHISDANSKNFGTYSFDKRIITIYRKIIENNSLPHNFPASLLAIEVMRHELEHAKSMKQLESPHMDLETLMARYSLKDYAISKGIEAPPRDWHAFDPLYLRLKIKENYETDPKERIAEIRAWKYLVNLLKNQRNTKELLTARAMLYHAYCRGYKNNRYYLEAPTLRFLFDTKLLEDYYMLKNRIDQKEYCFDTRLLYGLPLTESEYDKKILRKTRLRKKESKN